MNQSKSYISKTLYDESTGREYRITIQHGTLQELEEFIEQSGCNSSSRCKDDFDVKPWIKRFGWIEYALLNTPGKANGFSIPY